MATPAEPSGESATVESPAPAGTVVTVSGRVVDQKTGEPVASASVFVFGSDVETLSDSAGRFTVRVPTGPLSLAVVHPRFPTEAMIDVKVGAKGLSNLTVRLPHADEVDDMVLLGKPIEGGAASMLAERRKSSSVQDAIGSEDIGKSPDGSASAATRRIVGASIVGGQYLFVRGLGGRYSNTLLNGIPLPSTDPDLPGFQLDLFPTALLSSLTITKTFTPDIPGDFAGGSLNVETRSFPEEFLLKLNAGGSGDTLTTGRTLRSYEGGETDYLGYDDGSRAAPESLPEEYIVAPRRDRPDEGIPGERIDEIGRGFKNRWAFTETTGYPNLTLGASVGNTHATKLGKVGYFFTLGYRSRYRRDLEKLNSYRVEQDTGKVIQQDDLRRESTRYEAQIGSLATLSYAPVDNHEFSLVGLLTQNGADQTRYIEGWTESDGDIQHRQFQFVERQLLFGQLLSKHRSLLDDHLDIAWQLNGATMRREQPDTRIFATLKAPSSDFFATKDSFGSGERLFTTLDESSYGGGLDAKLKVFTDAFAKAGYMGRTGERQFGARRFKQRFQAGSERLPPEELFQPENAGDEWILQELTIPQDGFDASQTLHAGYLMADFPATSRLRVIAGVRREQFNQTIQVVTPYRPWPYQLGDLEELESADRTDRDWLPAGSLVVTLTDQMNLRAAYGGTVARPQLRELAPFASQDLIRRRLIQGNPALKRTFIHNFDLRWELFPSGTEVFAISTFYKIFRDPIESVIISNGGNLTFENIRQANSYGAEFEARWSLGLLSDQLADWSAVANLALIHSRIELYDEQARNATTQKRAMAGQSPFIVNASVGYEPQGSPFSAFLYYNVFGRRIQDAGRNLLPDIYEEPVHQLDLGVFFKPDQQWVFSLSAANLLLQSESYTQGGENYSKLDPALQVSLNAAWTY